MLRLSDQFDHTFIHTVLPISNNPNPHPHPNPQANISFLLDVPPESYTYPCLDSWMLPIENTLIHNVQGLINHWSSELPQSGWLLEVPGQRECAFVAPSLTGVTCVALGAAVKVVWATHRLCIIHHFDHAHRWMNATPTRKQSKCWAKRYSESINAN